MTTTITGTAAHVPTMFTTYGWRRDSRSIVHALTNTANTAVTLRAAGRRAGRFGAVFATKATAMALEAELATARTFTLADTDHAEMDMTFMFDGQLELKLDPLTRRNWILSWDFLEVT